MKIKKFNENSSDTDSPCIGVCKLDDRGVCLGCKRTAKQIANWWDYSDEEKRKILKNLKKDDDWNISPDYYGGW